MSLIARAEWDFSKCPADQLELCHEYEFRREDDDFKMRVRSYRTTLGNWNFAELIERWIDPERFEWSDREEDGDAVNSFFYGPHCWFFDEFPRAPFLSVSLAHRKKVAAECTWERSLQPARLKEVVRVFNDNPSDDLYRGSVRVPNTPCTVAAFWIDWEKSPEELTHLFERWMKEHRDKTVAVTERRGKGDASRRQTELKQLGTWRLLNSMSWEDAFGLTREHLGKGLWCDRGEVWARAFKAAEKLLAKSHG